MTHRNMQQCELPETTNKLPDACRDGVSTKYARYTLVLSQLQKPAVGSEKPLNKRLCWCSILCDLHKNVLPWLRRVPLFAAGGGAGLNSSTCATAAGTAGSAGGGTAGSTWSTWVTAAVGGTAAAAGGTNDSGGAVAVTVAVADAAAGSNCSGCCAAGCLRCRCALNLVPAVVETKMTRFVTMVG